MYAPQQNDVSAALVISELPNAVHCHGETALASWDKLESLKRFGACVLHLLFIQLFKYLTKLALAVINPRSTGEDTNATQ